MVAKLFRHQWPLSGSTVLDPGCGTGAFIEGVMRWCCRHSSSLPRIVGIESDPRHLPHARQNGQSESVTILHEDFLAARNDTFDYIIGNPPYVPITGLSEGERAQYRAQYKTASGRFDLYLLFFEQALRHLNPGGRLVFITPEKFLYVRTAAPLRRALARLQIEEIHFLDEATFGDLVTYPVVTTVVNVPPRDLTRIVARDGITRAVHLAADVSSWLPAINGLTDQAGHRLEDACLRISCGVATGADSVYVSRTSEIEERLSRFAYPTIAGREINNEHELASTHSMLVPYKESGELLSEEELGELGDFLNEPERRSRLEGRTCAARKPWYAFHENPPLPDILQPKILCKDITARPFFLIEPDGVIVPRHSVYYLVPNDQSRIQELCDYLNSEFAQTWLRANCQRAANGFLRLQSHVLKRMPVPAHLVANPELELEPTAPAAL